MVVYNRFFCVPTSVTGLVVVYEIFHVSEGVGTSFLSLKKVVEV